MRGALLAGLAILGLVVAFRLFLPKLVPYFVFYPEPLRPHEGDPKRWGFPEAAEVWLEPGDGPRLHAWWFPAGTAGGVPMQGRVSGEGERCGAAVYFHGNAGNLASRGEVAAGLSSLGLDVLLIDYRGYGQSEGRPTEEGLYRDAEAAYRFALERSGVLPDHLVLVGNSLGSAVAVELASRRPVGGLILAGPFSSTVSVGREVYWWLPDWFLEWDTALFDTLGRAGRVRAPALVVRASRDHMISREDARRVFEALPEPKRWYEVPDAGHNDVFGRGGAWREMRGFLREVLGCP